jgi:hypothetical protein
MHTKDMLAAALRHIGLTEMADKAATGYYHDYLSPLDLPEMELMNDLAAAAAIVNAKRGLEADATVERVEQILALRARCINGEFDASKEESDDWAKSAEGQAAFRMLHRR